MRTKIEQITTCGIIARAATPIKKKEVIKKIMERMSLFSGPLVKIRGTSIRVREAIKCVRIQNFLERSVFSLLV